MKYKLSIDFAIITSLISIFLFTCGYFYLDSFTHFLGFSHTSLGFTFQDYLMYGWVHNIFSLFLVFVIFLIISIINALQEQDLYESIVKIIFGIIVFFSILLWRILYRLLRSIGLFLMMGLNNSFLVKIFRPTKHLIICLLKIFLRSKCFFVKKLRPKLSPIFKTTKQAVQWDNENDQVKVSNAQKVFERHYWYLVLFYLLFLLALFHVIHNGKMGEKDAEKVFSNNSSSSIIMKNELLNEWMAKKNFSLESPVQAKLFLCGSSKCLVGIPNSSIKNKNYVAIPSKHNYIILTIDANQYIYLK